MSEWDERHPREPDPGEGVRIIGPQRDPRDPRDPRASQDDPRRWGNFAETQPRWSDDQGYEPPAEPPPGRSVFGDDPAPPVETYEDAYRDQNYDDRGAPDRPAADEYYGDQGYGDHPRQPPPPPPSPRGQGFDQSGHEQRYDEGYDDSYVGEAYQDAPRQQAFVEPPPPVRPRRERLGSGPGLAPAGGRDMRLAVGVGVGLVVAALVVFKLGPAATMVLVVAILALASYEYFTATQRAGFDPLMPVGVAATVGMALTAYHYGESAMPLVLTMSFAVCTIWYLIGAGGERPMANVGATLLGICWVGLLGSYAALLLGAPNGIGLLLAAIVPTVGYDVGALFVGQRMGQRALSAASPNKTVEGLGGGMILAVVGGCLLGLVGVAPFDSLGEGLIIGLVAAVAAPLGDLSESLIKRDLGIKDMGTLLPGHGGVLDRFDALLFVLPAIWYAAVVKDGFLL